MGKCGLKPAQKFQSPGEFTDNNLLRRSGPNLKALQSALGQRKIKVNTVGNQMERTAKLPVIKTRKQGTGFTFQFTREKVPSKTRQGTVLPRG